MLLVLLEQIEAIDATDSRCLRKTGQYLFDPADQAFIRSIGTRLCAPVRPITCRELIGLMAYMRRATASPYATAGDPSFIRVGEYRHPWPSASPAAE